MELLTVKELARLIKYKERYIYNLVQGGRIPFVRIGRSVRFDPKTTQLWIKNQNKED